MILGDAVIVRDCRYGQKSRREILFGNETAACACKGNAHEAGFAYFRRTNKQLRPTGDY